MAKVKMYICDICGEHIKYYGDIIRIKARHGFFVNFFNMTKRNADLQPLDVCTVCVDKFKTWREIRKKRAEENEKSHSFY